MKWVFIIAVVAVLLKAGQFSEIMANGNLIVARIGGECAAYDPIGQTTEGTWSLRKDGRCYLVDFYGWRWLTRLW